ncbi:hypothetical protein BC739_006563 [Kutzneria viridogrisea]|uniref:Uncharacterized protein n=1 Tax=Kutzneria viridogrisea TaxID=47990 RepID=A0ABR6BR43_9PSEU|nr:hypothetical protein [Kutzneria viridogrisea]
MTESNRAHHAEMPMPRRQAKKSVRVEPLAGLEWSQAVELAGGQETASRPADIRRAWIHRAPERQVVGLYRVLSQFEPELPAPWWLRALASGGLNTRKAAFKLEDEVGDLLLARPGWVYVPWAGHGEDGYWEYVPSEAFAAGESPTVPTTVLFTPRHRGWLDVLPAHRGAAPTRLSVRGIEDLRSRLDEIEAT